MRATALAGLVATLAAGAAHAQQNGFASFDYGPVHPIATSADGALLFVCNTPDAHLSVYDLRNAGAPVLLFDVPVGLEPVSVRPRTADEVWVVNALSDSVSVVSLSARRVVATLRAGDEPADVCFAGSPERAFVSVGGARRGVGLRSRGTRAPHDGARLREGPEGVGGVARRRSRVCRGSALRQRDDARPAGGRAGAAASREPACSRTRPNKGSSCAPTTRRGRTSSTTPSPTSTCSELDANAPAVVAEYAAVGDDQLRPRGPPDHRRALRRQHRGAQPRPVRHRAPRALRRPPRHARRAGREPDGRGLGPEPRLRLRHAAQRRCEGRGAGGAHRDRRRRGSGACLRRAAGHRPRRRALDGGG